MTAKNHVIGIDPGYSGAFVKIAMDDPSSIIWMRPTPLVEVTGGRFFDFSAISRMIKDSAEDSIFCLERVGVVQGASRSSVWSFAEGYGALKGILAAHGCELLNPTPKTWQSWAFIGQPTHLPPKDKALLAFRQKLPHALENVPLIGKKPHDGIIDAALLALFAICYNRGYEARPISA